MKAGGTPSQNSKVIIQLS